MNKKFTKLMAALALLVFMTPNMVGWGQTRDEVTIYSEAFGDNGSNNTAYASYNGYSATTDMFVGTGTVSSHYSGSGKVGKNSVDVSTNYTDASGKSAAWYTAGSGNNTTQALIISGISIQGYTDLQLSFGMLKKNGTSSTNVTSVTYSIDNGTAQSFSFTHPTDATWHLISGGLSGTGESLTIAFTMTTSGGFTSRYDDIKVIGTPIGTPTSPTISADAESLEFAYVVGGSAEYQSLVIEGSNLEDDITVSVTGTGFSISEDGDIWQTTDITISQSDAEGLVAVRLDPGLSANDYSGTITLSSEGADDVTVSLTGTVSNPSYTIEQYSSPATAHGTITFEPTSPVEAGQPVAMTATPADGYVFVGNSWVFYKESGNDYVVDNSIIVTNGNTITMPFYNLYVDATFSAKPTYAITTSVTPENSGIIETDASAWEGKEVIVLVEAATGYVFSSIVVNKTGDASTTIETQGSIDDGFTFEMPAYPVTVTATFTEIEIHTVAWAMENTPNQGVYVQGIVSDFYRDGIMGDGQNFRYYISDNGGTYTDQLLVYKGKDLGNVAFDNENDLLIGDIVVIYGDLTTYQGQKEFNSGNYIVSKTRPVHNPYNLTIPTWENFELFAFSGPNSEPAFDYSDDEAAHWGTVQVNDGTQVELSISVNEHYTIQSLFVDGEDVADQIDESGAYFFMMPTHAVTVTATVVANMVSYNYNVNGTMPAPTSIIEGSTITLASCNDFNEEFTFAGWTTNPNDFNTLLQPNATYTLNNSETIFYAVYAKTETGMIEEKTIVLDGSKFGSSQPNSQSTITSDGITYAYIGAKQQTIQSTAQNYFTNTSAFLIGKSGKYLYNTTAFGEGITNFEIYNNKNASTNVQVGVCFSTESLTQYATGDNTWELQLNPDDNQFVVPDNTIPSGAKYFYFKINSDHNAQVQFRITYSSIESTTNYYTRVFTKEITAYNEEAGTGWNFIASPVGTAPVNMDEISDLYYYDEPNHYWRNKKLDANVAGFDFAVGKSYLCADKEGVTLTFAGTPAVTETTYDVSLAFNSEEGAVLAGWNLVGNPFDGAATINKACYTIDGMGLNSEAHLANTYEIAAGEGVMVKADAPNENATFTVSYNAGPMPDDANQGNLQMTVAQQVMSRGTVASMVNDNAIVSFNEGNRLEKFAFNADAAKLYIPQNGKEYAIVSAEAQGEMPVNFRAAKNGTYTLSINPEGVEMNYLHLIDNMTGANIDLLQTPSYTFNASMNDYESRFKLVFAAGSSTGSEASETFAFFANGELIVSNEGEATLQVVDMTGRILSSQSLNGNGSVQMAAPVGVYVLRLISGNEVKTQKIVVR